MTQNIFKHLAETWVYHNPNLLRHDRIQEGKFLMCCRNEYQNWQKSQNALVFMMHSQHHMLTVTWISSHQANWGTRKEKMHGQIIHERTQASARWTNTLTCHCLRSWSQEGCVWSWSCGQVWVDSWCVLSSPSAVDLESPVREWQRQSIKHSHPKFLRYQLLNSTWQHCWTY